MGSNTPSAAIKETWMHKPDEWSVAADTSSALDVSHCDFVTFHIHVGTLGASGTVDLKVQSSATSGGSYSDISGAAISQITTADTSARIELNLAPHENFLKTVLTVGTAASDVAVVAVQHGFNTSAVPSAVSWVSV